MSQVVSQISHMRLGLSLAEWPFFWAVFVEDFPPRDSLRRGEVHLERVAQWLHDHYPVSHVTHVLTSCYPTSI